MNQTMKAAVAHAFGEPLRIEERRQSLYGDNTDDRLQAVTDTIDGLTSLDISSLPSQDLDFKILSAGSAVGSGETDPVGRLRSIRGVKGEVTILCRSRAERDRLAEIFARKKVSPKRENFNIHPWLFLSNCFRGANGLFQ